VPTRYPDDPSRFLLIVPLSRGGGPEDSLNTITSLADEVRSLRKVVGFLEGELSRAEDAKKLKRV